MPVICPKLSDRNLTPSSTGGVSPESAVAGASEPKSEHPHPTLTTTLLEGVSMLPLSSVARAVMIVDGFPCAVQVYVQLVVPDAGCHVAPPSRETSPPATTPPPASLAVPEMVTFEPSATVEPAAGDVTS